MKRFNMFACSVLLLAGAFLSASSAAEEETDARSENDPQGIQRGNERLDILGRRGRLSIRSREGQFLVDTKSFTDPAWSVINLDPSFAQRYFAGGVGTDATVLMTDAPAGFIFKRGDAFGTGNSHIDINTGTEVVRISQDGVIVAAEIVTTSSRVFKDNITVLSDQEAAEVLARLQPVSYHTKGAAENEVRIGFIAEDVPDLVATAGRSGVSAMDIAAVLTKVVQRQQDILEQQEARIDALEFQLQVSRGEAGSARP